MSAIGNKVVAAQDSDPQVERSRKLALLSTGFTSIMLTSRRRSARPPNALGWERDSVTAEILGGVNLQGGTGTILVMGIAALAMGLGSLNRPGIIISVFMGAMLSAIIALRFLARRLLPHWVEA